MANDYYGRDRNRGLFGYEGEGFMRGADDFPTGFAGGYGYDREPPRGYRNVESGMDRGARRPSFRGRGPKNYSRSDERIREEVCERLTMDHDVDASDIEVNVSDATVTLSGTVDDRHAKRRAEDIADSVHGVTDVQNQIRVSRPNEGNP